MLVWSTWLAHRRGGEGEEYTVVVVSPYTHQSVNMFLIFFSTSSIVLAIFILYNEMDSNVLLHILYLL